MSQPVRVLLLEDDARDAELARRSLEQRFARLTLDHASTREQYLERLAAGTYDVIVCDGSVPGCEGLTALHLAHERHRQVPFISLSGLDDPGRDLRGLEGLGVEACLAKSAIADLASTVQRVLDRRAEPADDARLAAGYERLVGVVKALSLARDLPAIMAIVRRAARELTGADGATFVLRDGDQCHYADEDAIGPLWKGQKFPMASCISGWAMVHRQPAVVEDIHADPRIPISAYEPTFVRSVVMVPIRAMDPIGAIGTYWARPRIPDRREIRLLQALADTTAVALENARIYQDLEARVRERTAELEAFTYAVSHDLRAPIRHLHGFATALLEDHGEALDPPCRTGLDRIRQAALRMRDMVDGLLALSRVTQAPMRREPIDLARLAREIAEEYRATAGPAVELVAPASLEVTGDPRLLRVVLENLLSNAWKFSSRTPTPRVELGASRLPDGRTAYHVRDNGIGFDEAFAGKLFGVFQRLHTQEEFPGTGIGLATVQRIVRRHGGTVWASSRPGQGATFFFTLEPDPGAPGAERPPAGSDRDEQRSRQSEPLRKPS